MIVQSVVSSGVSIKQANVPLNIKTDNVDRSCDMVSALVERVGFCMDGSLCSTYTPLMCGLWCEVGVTLISLHRGYRCTSKLSTIDLS